MDKNMFFMLFTLNYCLIFVELKYFLTNFHDYVHYVQLTTQIIIFRLTKDLHVITVQHQTFNIIF